jgi:tRNA A-37 threonylcarbamoyl transferase component Bud32
MTTDDRWRRVRDLFERAFEESPVDIDDWLDREGVTDALLREEVLSLVRHHKVAGSFLAEDAGHRLSQFIGDSPVLETGQVLGQYTIVRELGRGGMGRVYLAKDRLGREVALKALSPDLTASPSYRERFKREALAQAALTHPGICTIHVFEEVGGELFIVSEFIDGHTLRKEIGGTRPSAEEVSRLARELAEALAHAHEKGVTHRDLKPENIMRTREGRLKILDFGLALMQTAAGAPTAYVTQPGALAGTPAYMAPEQLNCLPADSRSDVFAFGVVLYEYASGTHPFRATTPLAQAGRILESAADPIETHRRDLPSVVVDVIERCLCKSPADRFASASEIVRELSRTKFDNRRLTAWWRAHQLIVLAMYFIACTLGWQIKEWQPGITMGLFVLMCVVATVGGVVRGHLLFTERMNTSRFAAEHRRLSPVLLGTDLLLGAAMAGDGLLLTTIRPVAGVLTTALGVGIALTRLVVEPSTTSASIR